MTPISSWGRLSAAPHTLKLLKTPLTARHDISGSSAGIAYGNGRSYGDACLNKDGIIWLTRGLECLIYFDRNSGRLKCESGVLLKDIQDITVPDGWILPVTPGTQLITVGGAIANDIHGKNHHVMGTFGDHIVSLRLLRTDGEIIDCGPNHNFEWFTATLGGIGLTGLILEAEIQLQKVPGPWLLTETIPFNSLEDFFELTEKSDKNWDYTASWIDCSSKLSTRGLFMRGNHTNERSGILKEKIPLNIQLTPPFSLINRLTLKPFNEFYFKLNKSKSKPSFTHYKSFFYPLDNVTNWNRLYGPKGFYQHQCVIPRENGKHAIHEILFQISKYEEGSCLAVLKTFGNKPPLGMLSFPMPGITLALDFPNNGLKTLKLLHTLDTIVEQSGGRLYLAKDACMTKSFFEKSYSHLNEFNNFRDPGISSEMSRRLMGN